MTFIWLFLAVMCCMTLSRSPFASLVSVFCVAQTIKEKQAFILISFLTGLPNCNLHPLSIAVSFCEVLGPHLMDYILYRHIFCQKIVRSTLLMSSKSRFCYSWESVFFGFLIFDLNNYLRRFDLCKYVLLYLV